VAEAKKDDFVQGRAQCLVEIAACLWNNEKDTIHADIYGIVSNGQVWQFYRRRTTGEIEETEFFNTNYLPELLGALDYVCGSAPRRLTVLSKGLFLELLRLFNTTLFN
jgi:hypothetical protein